MVEKVADGNRLVEIMWNTPLQQGQPGLIRCLTLTTRYLAQQWTLLSGWLDLFYLYITQEALH